MQFILFIASRIRPGQFPKLPDFQFSQEHQKYLYQGRALEVDEFNAACEKVYDEKYRSKGFLFRPMLVEQAPEVVEPTPPHYAPSELSLKRQAALDKILKMNAARAAKKANHQEP